MRRGSAVPGSSPTAVLALLGEGTNPRWAQRSPENRFDPLFPPPPQPASSLPERGDRALNEPRFILTPWQGQIPAGRTEAPEQAPRHQGTILRLPRPLPGRDSRVHALPE